MSYLARLPGRSAGCFLPASRPMQHQSHHLPDSLFQCATQGIRIQQAIALQCGNDFRLEVEIS